MPSRTAAAALMPMTAAPVSARSPPLGVPDEPLEEATAAEVVVGVPDGVLVVPPVVVPPVVEPPVVPPVLDPPVVEPPVVVPPVVEPPEEEPPEDEPPEDEPPCAGQLTQKTFCLALPFSESKFHSSL